MREELMLKLLKDGECVGYAWHGMHFEAGFMITLWFNRIPDFKNILPLKTEPKHDSFEQGIKVDDEWVFGEFLPLLVDGFIEDKVYRFRQIGHTQKEE